MYRRPGPAFYRGLFQPIFFPFESFLITFDYNDCLEKSLDKTEKTSPD